MSAATRDANTRASVARAPIARASIDRLLSPRAVAIIGSLSRVDGLGARTERHLRDGGFGGRIIRAGAAAEIELRADGEIEVDVAVVAVPAAAAPAIVAELDGRVAHVLVYSSGFDEAGGEGLRPGPSGRTRIVGPNSVGLYYAPSRTMLTFAVAFDDMTDGRHGSGVVLISQSGAFGARLVRSARRHGLGYDGFIGTGNENDYGACELALELVASDTHRPRIIALYLESVRDGIGLARMLRAADAAGVRVVMLLGGASDSGASAARSHTAAVSPDHAIAAELCNIHNGVFVRSDRELVEATIGLALLRRAGGGRVGVITGSGGAGVVAADLLAARGLPLPTLSDAAQRLLAPLLPSYASAANPVDVTASVIGDTGRVAEVRAALVATGEVDSILVIGRTEQAAAVVGDERIPVVVAVLDGDATSVADSVRAGLAVLPSLAAACNVIRAVTPAGAGDGDNAGDNAGGDGGPATHRILLDGTQSTMELRSVGPVFGDAASSLRLVAAAGVAVAAWRPASSVAEARRAGDELGWPVVVKANLPAETHKAAMGGIRLDVYSDSVTEAAEALLRLVPPQDSVPSLVVAKQLRAGPELFVGVRRDPVFGLVVVAGLGGGQVELIGRTVTVPASAPVSWLASRLRAEVFGRAGARYHHLSRLLATTAATLAGLAERHKLDLVECNPLVEVDNQLIALDARVIAE